MVDPDLTLKKIRTGDLGNMSDVLKSLVVNDFDAVAKITANFITANNEREAIATRKKETAKLAGQAEAVNLLEQIFPLAKNNPARKPLIDKLLALPPGSTPIGTLDTLLSPDKPTGDGDNNANYNALGLIYDGKIKTKEELDKIPGLSIKQRTALLKVLNKDDKTNDSKLDSAINKLSDLPETSNGGFVIDPKSESFKKRQKLKLRAAEIENDAVQKGKPITAPEIIEQLEKEELDKKNRFDAKQAQDKLNNYARNPDGKAKPGREWITGPINKQSIEALRRQAGNDPVKLRQVRDMEALLKQAEGN
jgi:hypothetical protein